MTVSFLVAVVAVHADDDNANDDDKVDCFSLHWGRDTGAEATSESDTFVEVAMLPFLVLVAGAFFEVSAAAFGGGVDDADAE